jgi:hypothetical protein
MPTEVAVQAIALLLFPGALSILVFGLVVEGGARALLGAPDGRGLLRHARSGLRRVAPAAGGAVVLLALGATQVAVPLSPVPASEHTVFIALGALGAGGWLLWMLAGADAAAGRLLLLGQVVWVLAVLGPALGAGSLIPAQVEGNTLPLDVVERSVAAVAYLAALPALLLLCEPEEQFSVGAQVVRLLSWAPQTALFASLVLPTLRDNAAGVLLFALICVGACLVAALVAIPLRRYPELRRRAYPQLLVGLAVLVVALALLAVYVP